jgi:predicted MPP superfamily phosphohydrolase
VKILTVLRFMTGFLGISVLVCVLTFFLLKNRLGLSKRGNFFLLLSFVVGALLLIVGPLHYRTGVNAPIETWSHVLQLVQYLFMGFIGVVLLTFIFAEIIQIFFTLWNFGARQMQKKNPGPQDVSRRMFLTEGLARGIVVASTAATGLGYVQAEYGPKITPVTLYPKNFPKEFDGLTIAQISDVHIGPLLRKEFLQSVVDQVLSLKADLIFITGDLVDGTVEQLRDFVDPLKQLHAREGIYFCTGNHEYYSGANEWMDYLETIGITVFRNSNKIFSRPSLTGGDSTKILIGGVYDWHADRFFEDQKTDPAAAAQTHEAVNCKILLAHNPYSIDGAAAAGFNLQVSGHTHAGQFYPFAFVEKLFLKHVEGLYQINENTQLYVNRGTGFWGPPNRLGKWSEITHFTLKSKS